MIDDSGYIWGTRLIAEYIGIYQVKALRYLKAGKIPGQFVSGRWAARRKDLDAYLGRS